MTWKNVDEKCADHRLETEYREPGVDRPTFRACVRGNGCIHVESSGSYIHICDLDQFIEALQELKTEAEKYFRLMGHSAWVRP